MKRTKEIVILILMVVSLWGMTANFIQMVKCPEITQAQIALRTNKNFVCDWVVCKNKA